MASGESARKTEGLVSNKLLAPFLPVQPCSAVFLEEVGVALVESHSGQWAAGDLDGWLGEAWQQAPQGSTLLAGSPDALSRTAKQCSPGLNSACGRRNYLVHFLRRIDGISIKSFSYKVFP